MLAKLFRKAPKLPPRSAACDRFLKAFNKAQAQKVLDVGCTDPSIFATLAHEGKQVVGLVQVDSEDADDTQVLNHLKHELEGYGVSCLQMPSPQSLPPMDTDFDAAVSEDMLSYLPQGPEGILQGVHQVLKPGGYLVGEIGADGNMETFRLACYDVLRDEGVDAKQFDPYFFPTATEFTNILRGCGYRVETMKELNQKVAFPCQVGRQDVALLDYLHVGMGSAFLRAFPDVATKRRVVEN
eukprot:EG_transcript_26893